MRGRSQLNPVRTEDCNVVYKGPSQDIGDLWCSRVSPGVVRTTWEPTKEQLELLAVGGRIQLTIMREPIPPVRLDVVAKEESEPVGEHGWKVDVEPGDSLAPPTQEEDNNQKQAKEVDSNGTGIG